MAKSLKSATTTIDISSATAPSTGQVLMAINSTTAAWQLVALSQLTDVTIVSPLNNDILLFNGTKWLNSQILSTVQTSNSILSNAIKNFGGGYGGAGVANNSTFTMQGYVDNTDSTMLTNQSFTATARAFSTFALYNILLGSNGTTLSYSAYNNTSVSWKVCIDYVTLWICLNVTLTQLNLVIQEIQYP